MKAQIGFLFILVIGMVLSDTVQHPRGCIYINGRCHRECEEGTRAYTTGCGHLTKEATCEEPNPKPDPHGIICDYSACYCEPPTVRHSKSKKCVLIEKCIEQETEKHETKTTIDKH